MDKTMATIAYIINFFQSRGTHELLGKVKLVKILWFADREFMYKHYKQITGLEYIKMPQGPLPKNIDKILARMTKKGIIKQETVKNIYEQHRFTCLSEPDLSSFTTQEISTIDGVILNLYNKTAKEISEETHDELWHSLEQGETMPVESIFLQDIVEIEDESVVNGQN